MPNVENPHFEVPFRWANKGGGKVSAAVVEQDSDDDVMQCVAAIVRTPKGFRLEVPEFGIENTVLVENGPNLAAIEAAVNQWEPRARYTLTKEQFEDILSSLVNIDVGVKSNG